MANNFAAAWADEFAGSWLWTLLQLAVTVALGVKAWLTWASDNATPTQVFGWMLALLIYVVAVVLFHSWRAWQKQRDKVVELEQQIDDTHPHLQMMECMIRHVEMGADVDPKKVPYQYTLSVALTSEEKRRPAARIRGRMVVVEASLLTPPVINVPIDNGYAETRSFHTKLPLKIPKNLPRQFVAFLFEYTDRKTGKDYARRFYYKWDGVQGEYFHNEFFGLSMTDTDRFVVYLRQHLGEWEV